MTTTTTSATISASSFINGDHFNLSHDSSNSSNSSINSTVAYLGRNEGLAVFEVAISATILFLAVTGNSVVVALLMLKRGKLSRMHLMMLHLSLADLSVAFFQVLPQMVWDITFRFQGGAFLCGAVKYLQLVTMYGSSYVLLAMAVDRYLAICRPFLTHSWGSRQAHLLVLAAWSFAMLFSLPQVFIFSLTEAEEGVYDCWATFDPPWTLTLYVTWNVLSVFVAPALILAALYGLISYTVWRTSTLEESLKPRYIPPHPAPADTPHPPHPPTCLSQHPKDTPPQASATSPHDEAWPDSGHTDHSQLIADPAASRTAVPTLRGESAGRISGSSRGPAGPVPGEACREARGCSHTGQGVQQNGNPARQGDLMEMVPHTPASSGPHDKRPNSSMPPGTGCSPSPRPTPPHPAATSAPPPPARDSAAAPETQTPPRAGRGKGGGGAGAGGRGASRGPR